MFVGAIAEGHDAVMTAHPPATRYAWLAIAASIVVIAIKTLAWRLTGSVGLLSDALESIVNLAAAVIALMTLIYAAREPDEDHAYGHGKVEYFSSGIEGTLILIAAVAIGVSAVPRLFDPQSVESAGIGIAVSIAAAIVNLVVARTLFTAAASHASITLEADARHLMTDVITSAGVIAGIAVVAVSGWNRLDAIIAIAVAVNIVWTGISLMRRSFLGLLDTALPADELGSIERVLAGYRATLPIDTHALRTRRAASRRFASVHIIVPGDWSIERGHALAEQIEADIRAALPNTTVFTHLEPDNDPSTWDDVTLDRETPTDASRTAFAMMR
jgi:cation diffusion facilitator family transporter